MTEKVQRQLAFALILAAIAGLIAYAFYFFWDSELSLHGYIAFGLGALFSFALGGGLMWLVFYSSRKGYDDIDDDSR